MRIAISTIALLACTSLASAADLGGPNEPYGGSLKDGYAPAGAVVDWSGFYVGAHAGYGWATLDGKRLYCGSACQRGDEDPKPSDPHYDDEVDGDGWFGGGQLGFNTQRGSWVFGLEGDVSFSDIDGDHSVVDGPFSHKQGTLQQYAKTWDFDLEHFGTARVRVGHTAGSLLVYLTGGLAWGKLSSTLVVNQEIIDANTKELVSIGATSRGTWDDTLLGWTVGGGGEWMLNQNWSIKAEYLYVDLGNADIGYRGADGAWDGDDETFDSDLDFHTVRIGVNYKFGR